MNTKPHPIWKRISSSEVHVRNGRMCGTGEKKKRTRILRYLGFDYSRNKKAEKFEKIAQIFNMYKCKANKATHAGKCNVQIRELCDEEGEPIEPLYFEMNSNPHNLLNIPPPPIPEIIVVKDMINRVEMLKNMGNCYINPPRNVYEQIKSTDQILLIMKNHQHFHNLPSPETIVKILSLKHLPNQLISLDIWFSEDSLSPGVIDAGIQVSTPENLYQGYRSNIFEYKKMSDDTIIQNVRKKSKKRKLNASLFDTSQSKIHYIHPPSGSVRGNEIVEIYFSISNEMFLERYLFAPNMVSSCVFGEENAKDLDSLKLVSDHGSQMKKFEEESHEVYKTITENNSRFVLRVLTPPSEFSGKVNVILKIFGDDVKLVVDDGYEYVRDGEEEAGESVNPIIRLSDSTPQTPDEVDDEHDDEYRKFDDDDDDWDGWFFHAVAQDDTDLVNYLVQKKKASFHDSDILGYTPLDIARHFESSEMIAMIEKEIKLTRICASCDGSGEDILIIDPRKRTFSHECESDSASRGVKYHGKSTNIWDELEFRHILPDNSRCGCFDPKNCLKDVLRGARVRCKKEYIGKDGVKIQGCGRDVAIDSLLARRRYIALREKDNPVENE